MGDVGGQARMVVLLSGSGRTLQNFVDRVAAGSLNVEIVGVLSSLKSAYGLIRAREQGIPTRVVRRSDHRDTASFSAAAWKEIHAWEPDLVTFAGWMCYLTVPPEMTGKVMNIHPALLPAFGGKGMYGHHVHEAVLTHGCKVSGCTVHFVDNEYDHGPIVAQRCVPVLASDDADSLAARVFAAECELYPEAVNLFASGRLHVQGRRVRCETA
jgi:formyltetrahydrofolate-dependent phosphoribosylglycinamide formyltransferase